MIKKLTILLFIFTLISCSGIKSDTRTFLATNISYNLGYDTVGFDGTIEQRIKKGPVMLGAGARYSPTLKKKAESGYQYSFNLIGRYYFMEYFNEEWDGFFTEVQYYWSGYEMKFSDGREWKKDSNNFAYSFGWDKDVLELSLTFSPKEDKTANELSYISGKLEYTIFNNWIILWELQFINYNQNDKRETGFLDTIGIGYSLSF